MVFFSQSQANGPLANLGAFLLVVGISIFGFSDTLTMLVSDAVGVGQFHFSRSLLVAAMILVFGKFLGFSVIPKRWKAVLARTVFMVTAIFLYFSVLPMMPIAEAGAGLFTSPIFVLLFSAFFFRERIGLRRIIAVVLGTIGILLILRPSGDEFKIYNLLPILSGAAYAVGSIITFRYLREESSFAILMSFIAAIGLCGAVVATGFSIFPVSTALLQQAPFLFDGWQSVNMQFWLFMLLIAACAFAALSMMTKAYQLIRTSYAAVYEYSYLVSVGFFSWLFYGVVPDVLAVCGIFLVILAGVIIIVAQQQACHKS